MNTVWLQIVVSGVLLVVIGWRTFVDIFATLGTSQLPDRSARCHPDSAQVVRGELAEAESFTVVRFTWDRPPMDLVECASSKVENWKDDVHLSNPKR